MSQERAQAEPTGWVFLILGGLATVALSVLAAPAVWVALFFLSMSMESYDTSGQGGPFRSCGPGSTECTGGSPVAVVFLTAFVVAVFIGVAFIGQAVGRHSSNLVGRLVVAGVSVGVVAALTVVLLLVR